MSLPVVPTAAEELASVVAGCRRVHWACRHSWAAAHHAGRGSSLAGGYVLVDVRDAGRCGRKDATCQAEAAMELC